MMAEFEEGIIITLPFVCCVALIICGITGVVISVISGICGYLLIKKIENRQRRSIKNKVRLCERKTFLAK